MIFTTVRRDVDPAGGEYKLVLTPEDFAAVFAHPDPDRTEYFDLMSPPEVWNVQPISVLLTTLAKFAKLREDEDARAKTLAISEGAEATNT